MENISKMNKKGETSFMSYIISVVLVALFAFALISFGVQLADDNSTNVSILNNNAINRSYENLEYNLSSVRDNAESQQESFFKDIPIIGEASLILGSLAGIVRVFFNSLTSFYTLFVTLISETLGIPSLILDGIVAIILISMVLLAWRVYRAGS